MREASTQEKRNVYLQGKTHYLGQRKTKAQLEERRVLGRGVRKTRIGPLGLASKGQKEPGAAGRV